MKTLFIFSYCDILTYFSLQKGYEYNSTNFDCHNYIYLKVQLSFLTAHCFQCEGKLSYYIFFADVLLLVECFREGLSLHKLNHVVKFLTDFTKWTL